MKYLMFVGVDRDTPVDEADAAQSPTIEEWFEDVEGRGKWVTGDRVRPGSEATTVRVQKGEVLVTDGPFTESKDWIVGFDILDCDDLDEAIEIASKHPMAYGGVLELRAFWPMEE